MLLIVYVDATSVGLSFYSRLLALCFTDVLLEKKKHFEDRICTMAVITYVANKLISSHFRLCITFFDLTIPENFPIGKVYFCEHIHSSGRDRMIVGFTTICAISVSHY